MIDRSALETERLTIRPFATADIARLVELFADPRVHQFVDDGSPLTEANAALWVRNSRANLRRYGYGTGAVEERAGKRLIGWAGIARPPGETSEIIYGLAKACWGKGYGREILAALVAFSQARGEVPIRATVAKDNQRSKALLRAAGFHLASDCHREDPETYLYLLD